MTQRAIHLNDEKAREAFLSGKWTKITRAGKYPQIDLTEDMLEEMESSYDPDFEMGVINLDHAPDGAALGKIKAFRKNGMYGEIQLDPASVTAELREAVTSGKFFRPSAEIYPEFSQLAGKPAYFRGVGILGNKSAQVRGLPRIEFEARGGKYVGLHDTGSRGYVCLDGHDPEEIVTMSDKDKDGNKGGASDIAKLEAEKADLAAKAKAKDDEIAALKAANEEHEKKAKAQADETANLSTRLKNLEELAALEAKALREERIEGKLAALKAQRRLSPAEEKVWRVVLGAVPVTGNDVVKLGDGEKAKSHDLLGGILAALESRPAHDVPFGDKMPTPPIVEGEVPQSEAELLAECKRRTEAAVKEGKVKLGAGAKSYYLEQEKELRAAMKAAN